MLQMLELNDASLMVLLGMLASSSVSSISIDRTRAFFFEGAIVDFAFAFSARLCRFLLTSGTVFEGNISAT
jgi:hypothetical protein